ncbi:MAG: glycosyltransferase [Candidatus Electrothrix sp. GW3-4]|uniref:glycosyltransferase n=1 Tax=Candidatus Electrothrix sp. GW3-4 TaxID=3126740 RepID=UPI0030D0E2B8
MRVAHMIDNLYFGGAQTLLVTFARAIREQPRISLTIISLRKYDKKTPIEESLRGLGVRVVFISAKKLWDPFRLWRLIRFLHREQFDVIHTHLSCANILGSISGRIGGIPVIASIHNLGEDEWGRFSNIRRGLETFALRHLVHSVMAVGHTTAEVHRKRLGKKSIIPVPNATELIPPLPSDESVLVRMELTGDASIPVLLSGGRLVEEKGYGDLLTAFAEVHQAHPAATLVIAGEGPLQSMLEEQVTSLNLQGCVRLLGARRDMPRLLASSDIYLSSSHSEGLSIAILEAMAAGLPVVATNVGDTARVVVKGTGLIVPPHEPSQLADAICLLLDEPDRQKSFGSAARTFIKNNYNPADWANTIYELYLSASKQV